MNKNVNPETITEKMIDTVYVYDTVKIPYVMTEFLKSDSVNGSVEIEDTLLIKCMNEKAFSTTLGMIECYRMATQDKLKEISLVEAQIFTYLTVEDSILFVQDTSNWNSYFKTEKTFLYKTFYSWVNYRKYETFGREASIDQAEWIYDITKHRLKNLNLYFHTLTGE